MPATESLTIEIQGDSSGLSQALDDALSQIESLQSAAEAASNSAGGIGGRLASVSSAVQPLQQVGQQLSRISQQAQSLAQQPISLNVQPALSALQSLMNAIQAVAAQLSALSLPPSVPGGMPGGTPSPTPRGGPSTPSPGLSSPTNYSLSQPSPLSFAATPPRESPPLAKLSESPATSPLSRSGFELPQLDAHLRPLTAAPTSTPQPSQIPNPATLPIRELVVEPRRTAMPSASSNSPSAPSSTSHFHSSQTSEVRSAPIDHSSSTVNHFGGITIEVRETADVNALMRDLRLQGLATRHRQG